MGGTDVEAEASVLWSPGGKSRLVGKDPDAGKDWGQEEKRTTEDEMVGWHHWLDGHEFEQAPGDGGAQGNLACCSPGGHKELDIDWANEQQASFDKNSFWVFIIPQFKIFIYGLESTNNIFIFV